MFFLLLLHGMYRKAKVLGAAGWCPTSGDVDGMSRWRAAAAGRGRGSWVAIVNVSAVRGHVDPKPSPEMLRRLKVPLVLTRANTHNVDIDGTRNTVVHLGIQLGKNISIMHSHSSLLHDVPHQETLDSLVLPLSHLIGKNQLQNEAQGFGRCRAAAAGRGCE